MENIVIPFRGLRYNPEKVGNIADVIAPPYDVIKPEERHALEAQHPANIIRLILSQPHDGDTNNANQYTRAAALLNQWIADCTFVRDSLPCYYIYDQEFNAPDRKSYTRRALIALGKLQPFDVPRDLRVILPHEKTHAGPKTDRLNLMRQCHANLSPIFLLYSDTAGDIEQALKDFTDANPPLIQTGERFGSTHSLWCLYDTQHSREIQSHFASKQLLIADGHHRYETALAFQAEMRSNGHQSTSYDYMMMNLVRMESPGLAVLAIHRLLHNISAESIAYVVAKLPEVFDVQKIDTLANLMQKLATLQGNSPAIGMYTQEDNYRLLIPRLAANATAYEKLDVTLVQDTLIKELFQLDKVADHISYTAYVADAVAHVKGGAGRVALLMNPTPVAQVLEAAMADLTMPQKSTYFYPKMATGFVLNLLNR